MYTSKNEVVAKESLANQYTELIVGLAIKIRNSPKSKFIFAFSIAKKEAEKIIFIYPSKINID